VSTFAVQEEEHRRLNLSLLLVAFTINSLMPGYSYTGPSGVDDSNLCKCNTVAYSLISACDACQSSNWITYVSSSSFPPQSPSVYGMRLPLGGLSIRTIVQKFCLPRREFPVAATSHSMALTRRSALSFPNPVPAGTRVPQWALIDVTVRSRVIYHPMRIVLTAHLSLRTTGTPTSLRPSVVGIHTCLFFDTFHTHLPLLDTPEVLPGALIGDSSGTGTAAGATATRSSPAPTGSSSPTSTSPPSQHSSNVGAIAGGVVGGVAAISIAAAAIFFYLRRQHPKAPPASYITDVASQPPMDEVRQPLSQEGAFPPTSSSPGSPMRLYVRVFFWSSLQSHLCSCRAFFLGVLRTRTIRPRTLGTKGPPRRTTPPPIHLTHRTATEPNPETPWLPCRQRSHKPTDITVCPPYDFLLFFFLVFISCDPSSLFIFV